VSPDQVDGYRTAGERLGPTAEWFINLVATYGLPTVIAVGTVAILAACCLTGLLWHLADCRRERRAERRQEQDDLKTCNAIWNIPAQRREEKP
jgi:hypothetical protein